MNTSVSVRTSNEVSERDSIFDGLMLSNKEAFLKEWEVLKSSGHLVGIRHPEVIRRPALFKIFVDVNQGQFTCGNTHFGYESTVKLSRVFKISDDFGKYYQSSVSHLWHTVDYKRLVIFDLNAVVDVNNYQHSRWFGRMTDIMRDLTGIVDSVNRELEACYEPS